jgi:hypothetical protein
MEGRYKTSFGANDFFTTHAPCLAASKTERLLNNKGRKGEAVHFFIRIGLPVPYFSPLLYIFFCTALAARASSFFCSK